MAELRDAIVGVEPEASMTWHVTASTDFLAGNPCRPPDWRWHRAGQLLEPRARRRRQDDEWVVLARAFRAALAKAHGDIRHPRLARDHPEVLGAYLLRDALPRRLWEVQARLLADQDFDEIGDRFGVGDEVIEAYEQLYYSVRHRLESPDWIAAMAIGPRLYEGFDPAIMRYSESCSPITAAPWSSTRGSTRSPGRTARPPTQGWSGNSNCSSP
jgi:hypothetical protein